MAEDRNADVAAMPFEAALAELERIVADLERGEVPLEKSVEMYERGERLKGHELRPLKEREEDLLRQHGRRWLGPFATPDQGYFRYGVRFERGLIRFSDVFYFVTATMVWITVTTVGFSLEQDNPLA